MSTASTWTRQLTLAQLARQEYVAWQRLREQRLVPAPEVSHPFCDADFRDAYDTRY